MDIELLRMMSANAMGVQEFFPPTHGMFKIRPSPSALYPELS